MGSLLSIIRHFTESVSCEQQNTSDMHVNYPCTYSYWELACRKAFKHFWANFCRRLTDIFNRKTGINISFYISKSEIGENLHDCAKPLLE